MHMLKKVQNRQYIIQGAGVLFDMVYTKRTIQNFDCLSSPVSE